jgi:glc operon protein GlcG
MKMKPRKLGLIIAAAAAIGAVPPGVTVALDMAPNLSLDLAKKMAAGCEATAQQKGWKMNISIVDNGANQIYFERMNGAYLGSGDVARRKAETSAKFPFPTRVIEELGYGKDHKGGAVPGIVEVPGIIAFAGGLPIIAGGVHAGGIGVSGGTADEDEACAQAGLDAVKDQLK